MSPKDIEAGGAKIAPHCSDDAKQFISRDALFWFADGSPHGGTGQIRNAFEQAWKKLHSDTYRLDDVIWIAVTDQVASCVYRFSWKAVIDGEPGTCSGRGTSILRRDEDGWKIVHEHLSHPPTVA